MTAHVILHYHLVIRSDLLACADLDRVAVACYAVVV